MGHRKKRLVFLIGIEIVLIVTHVVLERGKPFNLNIIESGWHYWVALIYGILLALYILFDKCPKCRKRQIARGIAENDWHWPEDKCWNCGYNYINKE